MRNAAQLCLAVCLLMGCLAVPAAAQLGERPGTVSNQEAGPKDATGLSLKTPRIRLIHTTDADLEGGSMYFQRVDPYLAFKMGKDLTQREFRIRDGVFSSAPNGGVSNFRGVLNDGITPAIIGNDQVSCGGCHNMPYRDAGADELREEVRPGTQRHPLLRLRHSGDAGLADPPEDDAADGRRPEQLDFP